MWLLDTVGPMAVKLQQEGNVPVRFLLAAVFIAKVTGALVPLIDHLRPPKKQCEPTRARVVVDGL